MTDFEPRSSHISSDITVELFSELILAPPCISDLGSSARDQKAFFVQESFRTLLRGCVQVLK